MSSPDPEFIEGFRESLSIATAMQGPRIPFDDDPFSIPKPPRHLTYVQIIRDGGFFASCYLCGSEIFKDRRSLAEAERDATAHGVLRHVYSRATLERHDEVTNPKEEPDGPQQA